jgi:hypothetical protein
MTETLKYEIGSVHGKIERRVYSPYVVAEVEVQASGARQAAEAGFRPLAAYIFGKNVPNEKIAMTTPVTAQESGEKIAITSPLTASERADGTYAVRFSMPSKWTLTTLPLPESSQVQLIPVAEHEVLALKFRGRSDSDRIASASRELVRFAADHGLKIDGEPVWAGYSAPYIPVPLRRWEMLLKVTDPHTEGDRG